jgi:tRNA uridine 5-carboxymethylaminomethyl modification enzyme
MPNVGPFGNRQSTLDNHAAEMVELEVKYEGYIERMKRQLAQFEELESIRIPERLDFNRVPGLSNEVRERLARNRPASVGMAQRMPGVTPAAVFALMAHLRKK